MSSVNLVVSTVIRAHSLDPLIHEGLENGVVLGLPSLLCQYKRVIFLSVRYST